MLRHGQPDFPGRLSYIYGHTDYPLSAAGEAQARALGEALADIPMQRIVSSDLARAAKTADIVAALQRAPSCAVERDAALREIYMGEWDGMPKDEVAANYLDVFRTRGEDFVNTAAPGGETFRELQTRGLAAFQRIVRESRDLERILLVAHGGIFWSIVAGLFDLELGDMLRFGLDYCALHLVEYAPGGESPEGAYRLMRYNWSPNLMDYMDFPIE